MNSIGNAGTSVHSQSMGKEAGIDARFQTNSLKLASSSTSEKSETMYPTKRDLGLSHPGILAEAQSGLTSSKPLIGINANTLMSRT